MSTNDKKKLNDDFRESFIYIFLIDKKSKYNLSNLNCVLQIFQ